MMTVTSTKKWLMLLTLGISVILLVLWSFFGVVYERVNGTGVALTQAGLNTVYAPATGQILSLNVEEGERISRGDLVGTMVLPEELEEIKRTCDLLDILKENRKKIITLHKQAHIARKEQYSQTERSLEQAIAQLKEQIEWQKELNNKVAKLRESGAISLKDWGIYKETLDSKTNDLAEYFSDLQKSKTTFLEKTIHDDRELIEVNNEIKKVAGKLASLLSLYRIHSRIISSDSGYVTDILTDPGQFVQQNTPLINIASSQSKDMNVWEVYAYFSLADGKKIKRGMSVIVTPTTVKAEREGSIRGFVLDTSFYSESRETINRVYRNDAFTESILKQTNNMPVQVKVILLLDPNSPSGFQWTSGKGPDISLEEGTLCTVNVAVKEEAPINVIFSKARQAITGSGVIETKMLKSFEQKK